MKTSVPSRLNSLLVQIAVKRGLELPDDGIERLLERDRELLIDALLQELSETGLRPGDEPNQRGVEIEEIIDLVSSIIDQPMRQSDQEIVDVESWSVGRR